MAESEVDLEVYNNIDGLKWTAGYYDQTSATNKTILKFTSTAFECTMLAVNAGDKYLITSTLKSHALYVYVGSDNKVISSYPSIYPTVDTHYEENIVIPEGVAFLCVNAYASSGNIQLSNCNINYPIKAYEYISNVCVVVDKIYPYGYVKRYGAKGDGVTDDTKAIQNALAICRSVFFSFDLNETYIVTTSLYTKMACQYIGAVNRLNQSYGILLKEKTPGLNTPIFIVQHTMCIFDNLNLKSATINYGIGIKLGVVGYNDVDAEVKNCMFYQLYKGIEMHGRGLYVHSSIFDYTFYCIDLYYDSKTSDMPYGWRAIRVENNRFHNIPNIKTNNVWAENYAVCINGDDSGTDTIRISGCQIVGNCCDFKVGLVKSTAFIKNMLICGNTLINTCGIAANEYNKGLGYFQHGIDGLVVSGNVINSDNMIGDTSHVFSNYLLIFETAYNYTFDNINIDGNKFENARKYIIKANKKITNSIISNNIFSNFSITDKTKYGALLVGDLLRVNILGNIFCDSNGVGQCIVCSSATWEKVNILNNIYDTKTLSLQNSVSKKYCNIQS